MKKIYLVFIVLIALTVSCTKNFEEMNTDKKNPVAVPGETLFSNAQVALADQIASSNVNLNVWKLYAQYWTETTYTDEANYNIVNRTIPDNTFRTYYRDILVDLKEASKVISGDVALTEEDAIVKQNKIEIINLLNIYAYQRLVDIFGNIPYTEALDIETTIAPVYDDAASIYDDLLNRLDAAIAALDDSQGSFGSADLYYGGDVAAWKKFGYSLKLKLGIALSDVNESKAKAVVEAAAPNVFASTAEDCKLVYTNTTPNTNPIYEDLVLSGRDDFVPTNTIIDIMNPLNDPRRPYYFDTIPGQPEYTGGIYGYNNSFSNFSHVASTILVPELPLTLLGYSEVQFYLAEAAARGFSVGDAADLYNGAVKSSIMEWGGTEADYDTYIAQEGVAYDQGNWQELIGTQSWIASYTRGLVGYNTWRRLDYPIMNIPEAPESDDGQVPKRFTYPVNEQTLNADNYFQAAEAIGGDVESTKLFWDVN